MRRESLIDNSILGKVKINISWNEIDLSTPQEANKRYNELISKMPEIRMRYSGAHNNDLYDELNIWPLYSEWSSSGQLTLKERLKSFEKRLMEIKDYEIYEQTIKIYCALYEKLGTNPLLLSRPSEQIFSLFKEKPNN